MPATFGFESYLELMQPRIEKAFRAQVADLFNGFGGRGAFLEKALCGGKMIRGCLLCFVCETLEGNTAKALPRAVALEMIQAASLVHDDFVDQDVVRRGIPAVWKQVGPRRAVLLGDMLFSAAVKQMCALSQDDGTVLSEAIALVAMGAAQEPLDMVDLDAGGVSVEECHRRYETIIALKTGVLFAAACELGVLAAESDQGLRQPARMFGSRVGEAYQVADDMHDLRRLLSVSKVRARQVMAVVPALERFAPPWESRMAAIAAWLTSDREILPARFRQDCRAALETMDHSLAQRLVAAKSVIQTHFPRNAGGELLGAAPAVLIDRFMRSAAAQPELLQE